MRHLPKVPLGPVLAISTVLKKSVRAATFRRTLHEPDPSPLFLVNQVGWHILIGVCPQVSRPPCLGRDGVLFPSYIATP